MKNIYTILTTSILLFSVALFGQTRIQAPNLRAPANEEAGQNPNVILDWDAVTGQTLNITYEVQIATKEDFSDVFTFPRTDLSAQSTNELVFGQMYYWRVKAYDDEEPSEWSETWSFTVLNTVTVTAPDIGDEVYVDPVVEWDAVSGILMYEMQLDTSYVWNPQDIGSGSAVNGTFVIDENNMWLVGEGGLVRQFDGTTWNTIDPGITEDLTSVYFTSDTTGVIVGSNGTILQLSGGIWQLNDTVTDANLTGVSFADADNGWAVGEDGTILKYTSGTWSVDTGNPDDNDLTGVFALSATDVWVCGLKKVVLHYDGTEWTLEEVGLVDLYSIWFNDASNGWVSGRTGKLYYYNGTEWTEQATGTNRNLYGISMAGNTGYAVGRNGTMVAFDNGNWSVITSGVTEDLNAIWLQGEQGLSGGVEGNVIRKSGTGFDSPFEQVIEITGDTSEHQLQLLPFGVNIYYRMRTYHAKDTSDWSSARSMFTQAAPELDKPNNNSSDAHLLTEFSWDEYEGAVDYIYQIDDDENFGSSFETFVDSTSLNHQMNFFDRMYYWRVKAQHPLDISEWSEVFNLTTASTVVLSNPDDGDTEVPSCPRYEWEEIVGAKSYQIMVDTDPNFSDPSVEESEIPSFQCQSPLPKKTVYYWKVRAISTLDTSDWSPVWSFETEGYIGIEDEFAADAVDVYPNPSDGTFTLTINALTAETYEFTVSDLTGRIILEENLQLGSGDNSKEYRFADLEKGIYLLRLRKGDASVTKKIFIK
jgi:photosystem II stability/assembly factor-like uncharacterized protein